jgi:16S rRNA (cytidine1402-2'-O)-methyltransferase
MSGNLYIVATPIGNLEDVTLRALRVLKEVDAIAAEDTRTTRKLLSHYNILTPLTSYYDQVESAKSPHLIELLKRGKNLALVSDAGTPTLSDPGLRLVRAAIREKISVVPVPGPSAPMAALSASGLATERFVFEGFLPAKKQERRARLRSLSGEERTLVFFEAPHRLKESLKDMVELWGDRQVVLAREVSKVYEEFLRGRLTEVSAEADRRELKGEMTLVVGGAEGMAAPSDEVLKSEILRLRQTGLRVKEIAQLLGAKYSYPQREIYRLALEIKTK